MSNANRVRKTNRRGVSRPVTDHCSQAEVLTDGHVHSAWRRLALSFCEGRRRGASASSTTSSSNDLTGLSRLGSRPLLAHLEDSYHCCEARGLLLQAVSSGGVLLDERGILLRHPVQLADGVADLADAAGLL